MGTLESEYEKMRESKKRDREALKRAGTATDLPRPRPGQAPEELSPPGSSLKVPGGWDLAKGKKKRKRRPLEGLV